MQPRSVTTAELAALIQPFVGKRLAGDTSASLEIDAPGQRYGNADVRSLDDGHVEVFFYVGCDMIPLAAIRRIVIRGKDAETTYEHVGAREMAL
jgi:hypothetical protein